MLFRSLRPDWHALCEKAKKRDRSLGRVKKQFTLVTQGQVAEFQKAVAEMYDEFKARGPGMGVELDAGLELMESYTNKLEEMQHTLAEVLNDAEFDLLKEDLAWEGSNYAVLSRDETRFLGAMGAYARGDGGGIFGGWPRRRRCLNASAACRSACVRGVCPGSSKAQATNMAKAGARREIGRAHV